MLVEQLSVAISTARTVAMLDNAARLTWRGLAEELIDEKAADCLSTAIEARRLVLKGRRLPSSPVDGEKSHTGTPRGEGLGTSPPLRGFPLEEEMSGRTDGSSPLEVVAGEGGSNPAGIAPQDYPLPVRGGGEGKGEEFRDHYARERKGSLARPQPCRSPDRARSISRRRQLAASGAVPGTLAAGFTTGELAVLTVVAHECQRRGSCNWFMDRIAAVAGVCRSTARNALRQAQALGLITVQERRHRGWRSETNIVRVVSREWLAWLRLGGGCKKLKSTDTQFKQDRGNEDLFVVCSGPSVAYGPHGNRQRRTTPHHT